MDTLTTALMLTNTTWNDSTDNFTTLNTTSPMAVLPQRTPLQQAVTHVSTAIIAIAMIGIGCAVDIDKVKSHLKKPTGVVLGVICQFVIMPLSALALAEIFQMDEIQTLGVLVMGSCPGGSISNLASYWLQGDMDLSITMTTASSLLALGMMPLLLYIFQRLFGFTLSVPFATIGITLATFIVPIAIGALIKWKYPKAAKKVLKALSIFSIIALLVILILSMITYGPSIRLVTSQYVCAVLLPFIGIVVAYITCFLVSLYKPLYLHHYQRRTISCEVGIQNTQLAAAIIQLSNFTLAQTGKIILFPIIYFVSQSLWIVVFWLVFQIYLRRKSNTSFSLEEKSEG